LDLNYGVAQTNNGSVRHTEWNDYDGPGEPFSGGITALFGSVAGVAKGIAGVPVGWYKHTKEHHHRRSHSPSHPSSPSPSPPRKSTDTQTQPETDTEPLPVELAKETGHGISKAARATARAPMEVSLAVAQGFHNAPRLFGDEVRRPPRITGIHSGLRAAGKEFVLGIYDGFSGLVLQPYRGAKEGGPAGFVKGIGRGVAGGLLKTNAATAGVIGFTLKGVHRELRKGRDKKLMEKIWGARVRQGMKEWGDLEEGEKSKTRERVLEGWEEVKEKVMQKRKERSTKGRLKIGRRMRTKMEKGEKEGVEV
jgi:hypothetical protein